jgi:uncharacterized OB-fold protein
VTTTRNLIAPFTVPSDDDGLLLKGSRCDRCGEVVFPAMLDCPLCAMPDCMSPTMLPAQGHVVDTILTERGPQGFPVPYIQAYIKLQDGPVIFTVLDIDDPREAHVQAGTLVAGYPSMVRESSDVRDLGWKFRVIDA